LAEAHRRKFERKAAGLAHAVLHELRQVAQMAVAGIGLGPGVADADDGAAVELVIRVPLILDPGAVDEGVLSGAAIPLLRPPASSLASITSFASTHRRPSWSLKIASAT